jgi:quinone-modifying oxidoreductase, subunit QmoC
VLAREFFEAVRKRGRNTESRLVLRLYAKTNPLKILDQALLGLRLLRTGRFSLRAEPVKDRHQIDQLLRAVDAAKATAFADKLAREVRREVARA